MRIAALAIAAGLGLSLVPTAAHAATYEELQQQVEDATTAYEQASANVDKINGEIDANEQRIADLEAEMPAQRERAAESVRNLYKLQQSSNGLVDLLLSSEDWSEFLSTLTYLDRIQSHNMDELQVLADMNAELQQERDTLSARHAQASQEADRALAAQQEALAAREEVRLQAIAQAEAERAAAEAAIAEAAKAAEENKTFTNASGQQAVVSTPQDASPAVEEESKDDKASETTPEPTSEESSSQTETPEPASEPVTITSERDAFIAKWAPRIDAYLGGSPLGGHGRTFAEAAWDYNVDPRWSPAISCIESSKGAICFRPYNAWGWGSASWSDWDSAIRSHVAGLSAGYGYTISTSAAQKYCPPTWQAWYSSVLAEMSCI
jgi:peptidoglycan hydrolase CwlO-like protein